MQMSAKQSIASQLLATGMSARQVSQEVGIHETTLVRWNKIPEFNLHVRKLIEQAESDSKEILHALKKRAVGKIGELLESENPHVALKAAESILDKTQSRFVAVPEHDYMDDVLADLNRSLAADFNSGKL